jgi:hydrogenase maturation protein HypF
MGRLFDAVASLAGVRHVVDYEAQAAIELEGLARAADARPADAAGGYGFALTPGDDGAVLADPAPVIRAAAADVGAGVPAGVIGARFHRAVAGLVIDLAVGARERDAGATVALTGGVFQNALLLAGTRRALTDNGFTVLCHRHVPPNDGGLALGQVLVAASGLT